ncbi:MAG: phosphoribosylaminoimidazolesuccinocarboxamide synthase [Bacteroidota bacterium]
MTLTTIDQTDFQFPGQISRYQGKVRDVYNIENTFLVIVASDRLSAFDHILPRSIPYKGQILNQIAAHFFEALPPDIPHHIIAVPDPNVTIAVQCKAFPVEIVVRAYLAGHAWREYAAGKRKVCGVPLPDGLKENDPLPEPIITPSTKSTIGHDEDITEQEILRSGLLDADEWGTAKTYALQLFQKGSEMARERGLILVDTKYEMGSLNEKIYVIDEIHTPDSSRYFYLDGYENRQQAGKPQKQLSKEFVRKWLMSKDFQGLEGQSMPHMDDERVHLISERYVELYEHITGKDFEKAPLENIHERILYNTLPMLEELLNGS